MDGYIKADFTNDFPLFHGDKFLAKTKLGDVHHYQLCSYMNKHGELLVCNDNPEYGYSHVELEWFRQREIYLNPFNKAVEAYGLLKTPIKIYEKEILQ